MNTIRAHSGLYILISLFLFFSFVAFGEKVTAQEVISTPNNRAMNLIVVTSPVTTPTQAKQKKKYPAPSSFLRKNKFPVTQVEANEEAVKVTEEMRKTGKLKGFGSVYDYPKPPAPKNFKIKPGDGFAYLSWDPVPGAGQYLLYISEDGKNYRKKTEVIIKGTKLDIGLLTNGKKYYFAVEAIGEGVKRSDRAVQTVIPVVTKPSKKL